MGQDMETQPEKVKDQGEHEGSVPEEGGMGSANRGVRNWVQALEKVPEIKN